MSNLEIHDAHDDLVEQAHTCTCGELDEDLPEMDVQTIPHAIRHAAIFGAVDALVPGGGLVISATHHPVPLLAQLELRYGDAFTTSFLEKGPQRWRILIRRTA